MKILKYIKRAAIATTLVLAAAFMNFAAQSPQALAEEIPKQRIQASPASLDFGDMKPGQKYTKVLKIQNTGSESLKYALSVSPYSVSGEDYKQSFDTESKYTDVTKWVTFSQDEGEIEPDKQDEITVTISVPRDVPAGGQYAAIMARIVNDQTSSSESSIATISQVGVIVYSNVDGNTRQEGSILENKIPSFIFAPPISATSIIKNTGNVHFTASVTFQVYPFFGGDPVCDNEDNPDISIIMPETQRLTTSKCENSPHLGIFKVKQTIKFLDKTETAEKIVFICPMWFLLIVLAVIFLFIFWIINHIRKRKSDA